MKSNASSNMPARTRTARPLATLPTPLRCGAAAVALACTIACGLAGCESPQDTKPKKTTLRGSASFQKSELPKGEKLEEPQVGTCAAERLPASPVPQVAPAGTQARRLRGRTTRRSAQRSTSRF